MAKKKKPLAGAALKARNKRIAKDKRAKKRRAAAPKKKGRRKVARKKKRRRSGGSRGNPEIKLMLAGAGSGWILRQTAVGATIEAKVPKIGNDILTWGAVLWLGNRFLKNAWLGRAAKATLGAGAFEFGASGFRMSGDHHMRGANDNDEMGAIDVDEFVDTDEYEPDEELGEDEGDDESIDWGEDIAA